MTIGRDLRKRYTPEEEAIIKKHYPKNDMEMLSKLLPGRSSQAIIVKASKLGIGINKLKRIHSQPRTEDVFKGMTTAEIAYLAGILDGEGCLRIMKGKPPKNHPNRSYTYAFCVDITNTHKEVMEWIHLKTNNYGKLEVRKRQKDNWRPTYLWRINGTRKSINFISRIKKYLIVKRKQAELMSKEYLHLNAQERENLFLTLKQLKREIYDRQ